MTETLAGSDLLLLGWTVLLLLLCSHLGHRAVNRPTISTVRRVTLRAFIMASASCF